MRVTAAMGGFSKHTIHFLSSQQCSVGELIEGLEMREMGLETTLDMVGPL